MWAVINFTPHAELQMTRMLANSDRWIFKTGVFLTHVFFSVSTFMFNDVFPLIAIDGIISSPAFKIDFYLCTSASTLADAEDTFCHSKWKATYKKLLLDTMI